jgi:NAD+ kinase
VISSVTLVVHHERDEAARLAAQAVAQLARHGVRVVMPIDDARCAGLGELGADDSTCARSELAVSLGGDGTMLRTVALVAEAGVPILGVNVGLLGYLTEVEPSGATAAIDQVLAGQHRIDERMMLETVVTRSGARVARAVGLNEMVVEKREAGHMVRLLPTINGSPFTPYAADGLIVATPTGSTAYAMSARGPILSPRLRALVVTPVSPHMLFDRSLVLDPDETISITLEGHRPATVSVDGHHVCDLEPGDEVRCMPAARAARLVRFGQIEFHQRLKAKFKLADR